MKVRFLLSLALVMALAATAAAQGNGPAPAAGKPKMVIEEMIHDVGEVKAGDPVTHTFKVRNTGTADLLIHSVAPS